METNPPKIAIEKQSFSCAVKRGDFSLNDLNTVLMLLAKRLGHVHRKADTMTKK